MTANRGGPLSRLGPASRWCLVAGVTPRPESSPSSDEFQREVDVIVREGLASVAVRALVGRDDHQTASYLRTFRRVALSSEMRAMAADAAGSVVMAELALRKIPAAVVKGPAVARLYPEGWPRPYADIDVVVSRADYLDAIGCSQELGFAYSDRAVPQWRWFDLVCREGINLHSPSGGNIDFHHHVPPWVLGSHLPVEQIIARSEPHQLCSARVEFAAAEDLVVVAALHILNDLWKGKLGLTSWRDVMIITQRIGLPRARAAFDRAGLTWLFDLLIEELALEVPEVTFSAPATSPALPFGPKIRLAALGWSNDASATRHRLAWATRLPPLNALAFLAGTAVPSAGYIHERHGSYLNYWKQGLRETVSTVRGSDYRMTTIDDYDGPPADRT
jgi:Uncharacterised nucleotidyltransferase